jgi:hypothetical protein
MAKHEVPEGQESTSESNGGPKHDTGKGGKHRSHTTTVDTRQAGKDLPPRDEGLTD